MTTRVKVVMNYPNISKECTLETKNVTVYFYTTDLVQNGRKEYPKPFETNSGSLLITGNLFLVFTIVKKITRPATW